MATVTDHRLTRDQRNILRIVDTLADIGLKADVLQIACELYAVHQLRYELSMKECDCYEVSRRDTSRLILKGLLRRRKDSGYEITDEGKRAL